MGGSVSIIKGVKEQEKWVNIVLTREREAKWSPIRSGYNDANLSSV